MRPRSSARWIRRPWPARTRPRPPPGRRAGPTSTRTGSSVWPLRLAHHQRCRRGRWPASGPSAGCRRRCRGGRRGARRCRPAPVTTRRHRAGLGGEVAMRPRSARAGGHMERPGERHDEVAVPTRAVRTGRRRPPPPLTRSSTPRRFGLDRVTDTCRAPRWPPRRPATGGRSGERTHAGRDRWPPDVTTDPGLGVGGQRYT